MAGDEGQLMDLNPYRNRFQTYQGVQLRMDSNLDAMAPELEVFELKYRETAFHGRESS